MKSARKRPPLITDLQQIAALAAAQREDNEAFGHYIDIMWDREKRSDSELDNLVQSIADEVMAQIDCTACANCCRRLMVAVEARDVSRMAQALSLTPADAEARYVSRSAAESWNEWGVMRCSPCPLLHNTVCSIYAHRLQACRDYPALTPDFRWLYSVIAGGAGFCPIIYNVLECLKVRLGW